MLLDEPRLDFTSDNIYKILFQDKSISIAEEDKKGFSEFLYKELKKYPVNTLKLHEEALFSALPINIFGIKNGKDIFKKGGQLKYKEEDYLAIQIIGIRNYIFNPDNSEFVLISSFLKDYVSGYKLLRLDMMLSKFLLDDCVALELCRAGILKLSGRKLRCTHERNKGIPLHFDNIFGGSNTEEILKKIEEI